MTRLTNSFLDDVNLICVVTPDVGETVRRYADALGIGPWEVFDFAPPLNRDMKVGGVACDYAMRVAFGSMGSMGWALLEPQQGPTIYADFLRHCGSGVHHVAFSHGRSSHARCIELFKERGYPVAQEGHWHGHYCYFGSRSTTHLVLELVENPDATLPEPLYRYPLRSGEAEGRVRSLSNGFLDRTLSIGIVTDDLDEAVRLYADELGIGPWAIYEGEALEGPPRTARARHAVARTGSFVWEIIEPGRTSSIFRDFLDRRGPGVHHVGVDASQLSYEECRRTFEERGCGLLAESSLGPARSGYFATEECAGTVFKLFESGEFPTLPET
ncbi:MAG: VOC family protein [Proteobacteria bacterium]|nr:VOC family protein [Pseudomonadota bacterium]